MALHRIDDKTVLNEEEYSEHIDGYWAFGLFWLGSSAQVFGFNLCSSLII